MKAILAALTGEHAPLYEWEYIYGENSIVVKAGLTEELYINGNLVDNRSGVKLTAKLEGQLETGEEVKVLITGGTTAKCKLFVDDQLLHPIATKTP